jgi:hypothetical protein
MECDGTSIDNDIVTLSELQFILSMWNWTPSFSRKENASAMLAE